MTKTDFKNTYEAFMHCDKNKLAKEFAALYSFADSKSPKSIRARWSRIIWMNT